MFRNSSFFTPLDFPEYTSRIGPNDTILAMGSCFAERMSQTLTSAEWNISSNPGGITFHPLSLARQLQNALDDNPVDPTRFVSHSNLWFHLDWHSTLHANTIPELAEQISNTQRSLRQSMLSCQWALITLGTAIGHYAQGVLATNCHKQPKEHFESRMSTLPEIQAPWVKLLAEWKKSNPSLQLLFTVSPVKHIRSGISQNTLSKARLLETVHSLVEHSANRLYFPAYEILSECLRDYRFYAEDMAHPSEQATAIILDEFVQRLMSKESKEIIRLDEQRNNMKKHKPLFDTQTHIENSSAFLSLKTSQIQQIRLRTT